MNSETKEILESMEVLFNGLNKRFDLVDDKFDEMNKRITKIETILENETNKKIQLLAEGFQSVPEISEKVDSLSEDMEVVKFDVDIVKKVVTTHSTELNKLGIAK